MRLKIRPLFCLILMSALFIHTAGICFGADETSSSVSSGSTGSSASSESSGEDPSFEPAVHGAGFSAILYNSTNGLPTSEANDIAETEEGFIWIGSYGGLTRYDGRTFEHIDSKSGITSVNCLHVDSQNRLWIGTNESGVFLMTDGEFRNWNEQDGLPSSSVRAMVADSSGTVYAATTAGIVMFDPDLNIRTFSDPRADTAFMNNLEISDDDLIFGLTNEGDVLVIKDGVVTNYIDDSDIVGGGINCIYPDPEHPGYVYFEAEDSIVYYSRYNGYLNASEAIDISPLSQVQRFRYINGRLWICARDGIGFISEGEFHHLGDLPMRNSINHVITDYQGNLWFTSSRQGVMKVVSNRFTDLYAGFGLPETVINTTCVYDSCLFIGTDEGLTILREDGELSAYPVAEARTASGIPLEVTDLIEYLKGCRIRSIIPDSRGRIWLSTWRSHGLLRLDKGALTEFTPEDGLFSDHVRTVCERQDGTILVANTGGVVIIDEDKVINRFGEEYGIENSEILTVAEGQNGDVLCGSDGGGIYIISKDQKQVRNISTHDGLTSGAVMRIKYDPARDVYWIVTGSSLAYMTSDYQVHSVDQFPYFNNFDLYENSSGKMWVLSSNGIYIVSADELLSGSEIDSVYLSLSDGLPDIATANSYSALTDDGCLYIAGSKGVVQVNIDAPFESLLDLKAAIPYVIADGEQIFPDGSGSFTLGSGIRRLTVYGYVFTYALSNPMVSYRLEGFDQEFETVRRSDLMPAEYTNLPGGTYRFIMTLHDPLTKDEKTISAPIIIEKAFYEKAWFYILCMAGVLLLFAFIIHLFIRRKMRILEKRNHEEAEKNRINTELNTARAIQTSMLPSEFPAFPDRPEFDIYATSEPAKEVGGDFYDFFLIDDDHLCLVMADVSGKGIPAALFMMISKVILQSCAMLGQSAQEILVKTNEALSSNNKTDMFVTVWLGILEISTGIMKAANAGHEYPVLRRAGGRFEILKDKHGFVIGGMEGSKYTEYEIRMQAGDKIFLHTDGVTEATDSEDNLFGSSRMLEALNLDPDASPEAILRNVHQAVNEFVKDAEQFDDLTMMCMEYRP